ncbi:MAG: NTF2 fold immunity protein [Flavitalea sp.]
MIRLITLFCFLSMVYACSEHVDRVSPTSDILKPELKSTIRAIGVGNDYKYCDENVNEEENRFVFFNGRKYLKKEKSFFNKGGGLLKVVLFKPEGPLSYDSSELANDTSLVSAYGWKIFGNSIETNGKNMTSPYRGVVVKIDYAGKLMYVVTDTTNFKTVMICEYDDADQSFLNSETRRVLQIAERIAVDTYGEKVKDELPLNTQLKNDSVWVVNGTLSKQKLGGTVQLELSKLDHRLLHIVHQK